MASTQNGNASQQPQGVNGHKDTHDAAPQDVDTDVLVVGAGVTGLTLAGLLAEYGVKAYTIAKHSGTAPSPRAHVTNQRTMEVFRDMGIEQKVVDVSTRLGRDLGNGVICASLGGLEIARYSAYGSGSHQLSDFALASPSDMVNSPQHILERVLLANAEEKGADIHFYHELVHIEETPQGVVARIRERQSKVEYTVRARYAVGADGGRSVVGQQVGFGYKGEHGLISMLTTWLEADLTEYVDYRPACIYIMAQPGNAYWVGSGTLVNVKPFTEWLFNRQYDAADGPPDMSHEAIIAYARKALGVREDVEFRVKDVSPWQVNNVVATEYRRGNIFVAGDAAHRHPPASGLGSNTCVQDAYNLAWKLKMVLSGVADDTLLNSYDEERQPVGDQVVRHAIRTLGVFASVPKTLGFYKGQSEEDGYASLKELFSDAEGAEQRRSQLKETVDAQNLRSNSLGIQLGRRYKGSSAVVDDNTQWPDFKRDEILFYEPTTHPGSYLPHAWVELDHKPISTLDIVGHGRFSLIVGIGGKQYEDAASRARQEFGIELPVFRIGYRCEYDDVVSEWAGVREITDRGALLVRPDRHIAWRCFNSPDDPTKTLLSALRQVLGHGEAKATHQVVRSQ
ncbi:hypothetical protein LTR10_021689 [Elasticomyces elasticus]|uniref:FAD-binding domain-containing protein n=1 Tax=Exophiala sideris TaxID=1016849 RepID=A0ABR0IVE1_9EURO|nr:hypothetical protein LTR10_021689 [Elasticomyces elasticus]KAK5021134.1 hypothetical protein LTS07_011221 [Exophiala sideris]KAK5023745.1 hypothetical protein LTR13_011123 [Exophiala sideris]KAK5048824.1 hypothetical protein LTR69_011238 [Exophiala sideris]KAK5176315.1 hypothetical protein LTR44_011146 [Eurotiomycetes sp. CCFEE 6388]